jgi:hypothetical protein
MNEWQKAEIQVDHEDWGNQVLVCPACGGPHPHQGNVRLYDRSEDGEETVVTTVGNGHSTVDRVASSQTRNPSERRHGLAVAFVCENCTAVLELTLAQHKGVTLPEWRFRVDPAKVWDPDYPRYPAFERPD